MQILYFCHEIVLEFSIHGFEVLKIVNMPVGENPIVKCNFPNYCDSLATNDRKCSMSSHMYRSKDREYIKDRDVTSKNTTGPFSTEYLEELATEQIEKNQTLFPSYNSISYIEIRLTQ